MAHKRKLDKGVSLYVDRHGRERARFRLKGMDFGLPHPSSPDYRKAYENALQGIVPRKTRVRAKSVGDLLAQFYTSSAFLKGGAKWRATVQQSLEQFRNEAMDVPVEDFNFQHIETMLQKRAVKVDGKGGPAAAARLHEQLVRIFEFAKRLRWIDHNPAKEAEMPVEYKAKGYHAWTDAELAQFRAHHPLGSKARLAMELGFWTALRRGDVSKLTYGNIKTGRLMTTAGKTGSEVDVMLAPDLEAAIAAMPPLPVGAEPADVPLLATAHGKHFTEAGIGGWFREQCDAAALPECTFHGLRKAFTRQAAEGGATQAELKAIGQWAGDAEAALYARSADQKHLADAAVRKVIGGRTSSNHPEKVRQKSDERPHKSLDLAGAGGQE